MGRRAAAIGLPVAAALAVVAVAYSHARRNPRILLAFGLLRAARAGGTIAVNVDVLGTLGTRSGLPAVVAGCIIKPRPGGAGILIGGGAPTTIINNTVQTLPEPAANLDQAKQP